MHTDNIARMVANIGDCHRNTMVPMMGQWVKGHAIQTLTVTNRGPGTTWLCPAMTAALMARSPRSSRRFSSCSWTTYGKKLGIIPLMEYPIPSHGYIYIYIYRCPPYRSQTWKSSNLYHVFDGTCLKFEDVMYLKPTR